MGYLVLALITIPSINPAKENPNGYSFPQMFIVSAGVFTTLFSCLGGPSDPFPVQQEKIFDVTIRIAISSTLGLTGPLNPLTMAFPGGGMPMGLPGGRTAVMSEQQLQEQRMVKMVCSKQTPHSARLGRSMIC